MIHVLQGCGRFQNRKLWFAAEGQPLTLPLLQLNYEIFHNMQLPAGLLLAVGENVWPGFSTLPLSPFCTAGTDREDSEKCPRVREQGRALFRVEPKAHGAGRALDFAQLLLHNPDGWGEQRDIISVSQRCDRLS
ncbi:cell division protein kinase 10 [Trichinella spiralis]|uniref:cell division protein kinase 10 n=1 Tax=Trichinella spiralis TaxID=6334 RepID=UPI0001EFDA19|nr:cell division protein kinase 10 [Trichinella spiralis]